MEADGQDPRLAAMSIRWVAWQQPQNAMHWGIVPRLVDGPIMLEFMQKMFDHSGFMPRWNCGDWSPTHGWLHILSDLATWGAYTAILIAPIYFVRKSSDVPFHRIFVLFGLFILACGTTHLIEAIIFWIPIYPSRAW